MADLIANRTPLSAEEEAKFRKSVAMLGDGGDHAPLQWSNRTAIRLLATLDAARANLRAAIETERDRHETNSTGTGMVCDGCEAYRAVLALLPSDTAPEPPLDLDAFVRETFAALRRRLVGTPPNVDSIDAAIGYALNDCEAAINAALAHDEPTWAHNAQNDPAGLYDDQWEPISAQPVPTPEAK